jgi:hypothetical protein
MFYYEVRGDFAYVTDCNASNNESVIKVWDVSSPQPTLVGASAPLFNGVEFWNYMLFRDLPAPPAQEQATELLELVEALEAPARIANRNARRAARGSIRSLIAKVESTIDALERGHNTAAIGKLGSFINEVEAMVRSDQLSSESGSPLILKANAIRARLGG